MRERLRIDLSVIDGELKCCGFVTLSGLLARDSFLTLPALREWAWRGPQALVVPEGGDPWGDLTLYRCGGSCHTAARAEARRWPGVIARDIDPWRDRMGPGVEWHSASLVADPPDSRWPRGVTFFHTPCDWPGCTECERGKD